MVAVGATEATEIHYTVKARRSYMGASQFCNNVVPYQIKVSLEGYAAGHQKVCLLRATNVKSGSLLQPNLLTPCDLFLLLLTCRRFLVSTSFGPFPPSKANHRLIMVVTFEGDRDCGTRKDRQQNSLEHS